MNMYYSPSGNMLCSPVTHSGAMPADAKEISHEHYSAILRGFELGKIMTAGVNGMPELRDPTPAVYAPPSVTMYQARVALLNAGLLDDVEAILAAMPDGIDRRRAHLAWEFASTVERTSSVLAMLAGELGLTDAQLDALFIAASQVQ